MELAYQAAGKHTKRAVASVLLFSVGWTSGNDAAFKCCQHALRHQVQLAHRDPAQLLCVFTDASHTLWVGMVTQIPPSDLLLEYSEQRHSPLAFLYVHFNPTQVGWATLEKEAFTILATVKRMHWLTATPARFHLFTDYNNLIFIFDPLAVVADLGETSVWKVLRWAVLLSSYNYVCHHIDGDTKNVWADLRSR